MCLTPFSLSLSRTQKARGSRELPHAIVSGRKGPLDSRIYRLSHSSSPLRPRIMHCKTRVSLNRAKSARFSTRFS